MIYTASGHQQVGLWDTDTARALAVAEGHDGSIKSISPLHLCEDVFATGGFPGNVLEGAMQNIHRAKSSWRLRSTRPRCNPRGSLTS